MRWADLVLNYLRVLVWPTVTVVLVLVFRVQLRSTIGRIEEMSGRGWSVRLNKEAKKGEALADALSEAAPRALPQDAPPAVGLEGILKAWADAEQVARELAESFGMNPHRASPVPRVLAEAEHRGLVNMVAVQLGSQMERVRNDLVHRGASSLTAEAADSILRSMFFLHSALVMLRDQVAGAPHSPQA